MIAWSHMGEMLPRLRLSSSDVRAMCAYNRWANERALQAASRLATKELEKPLGGSFASLHGTLVHILAAEWIWLERWRGRSPRALLTPEELPDLPSLCEKWSILWRRQREFCESLADADLARVITYVNPKGETWSYPLAETLWHVVNHGSYHRGQVTTLLRQLGGAPAATDFLLLRDESALDA